MDLKQNLFESLFFSVFDDVTFKTTHHVDKELYDGFKNSFQ